ncbi:MAG: class I SAM-dependent methyltransferase [Alphaproteobacteria bacterium]|nr:class I SAM-dependent methyltransferase [Alphaproteobacteria bacterium]
MVEDRADDGGAEFYRAYASYKRYHTPVLGAKQRRRFDAEVWLPAECTPAMTYWEIGCGTGAFLSYLGGRGVREFVGIDHDPALASIIPSDVSSRFVCIDVWEALVSPRFSGFDRVVMLDVLEHFPPEVALRLLTAVREHLAPGGKIILKVPNAGCPWGLTYQFGDLTHRTAFSPPSLRQLADAAGFGVAKIYPQRQGSFRRMITDALVHRFLSWALLSPPEFWSANLYAVLAPLTRE